MGILAVGVWLAWCGWMVARAHDEIQAGRELSRAIQHDGYEALVDGEGRDQLDQARASFSEGADRLDHPVLRPLRAVPVLGRQLTSATALAQSVSGGLDAGGVALERLDETLGGSLPPAAARPAALHEVSDVARELAVALEALDLGPSNGLMSRLELARSELAGDLDELTDTSRRTADVAEGLGTVLDGPGRWLLLASNNAQMQNGSGMFLSYGVMEVSGGQIDVGAMRPTLDLLPTNPVDRDPEDAAAWPWMDPNGDFRHLGTSSRFDATAETAAEIFAAAGNEPVDGVIAVDAFAVRALLMLTGPVDVDGGVVAPETVVEDLLHDQYAVFGGAGATDSVQAARRERLGTVVAAAMEAFGGASELRLHDLEALVDVAHGRHLLAWAAAPEVQSAFVAGEIDGSMPSDGLLLSVLNRGGNKLDWFLGTDASLFVTPDPAGDAVEVRVRLDNEASPGEPPYVAGPYPGSGLRAGDYLGVAVLTVPTGATELRIVGGEPLVQGADGTHPTVGAKVEVAAGGTAEVTFAFRLPPGVHELRVVPAARARFTTWSFAPVPGQPAEGWEDVDPRTVRWGG